MSARAKKTSSLSMRLREIDRELTTVDTDLRELSKSVRSPEKAAGIMHRRLSKGLAAEAPASSPARAAEDASPPSAGQAGAGGTGVPVPGHGKYTDVDAAGHGKASRSRAKLHDDRLANYLATSIQASRPLRHTRRIERNKAIVMIVLAMLGVLWLLYLLFL